MIQSSVSSELYVYLPASHQATFSKPKVVVEFDWGYRWDGMVKYLRSGHSLLLSIHSKHLPLTIKVLLLARHTFVTHIRSSFDPIHWKMSSEWKGPIATGVPVTSGGMIRNWIHNAAKIADLLMCYRAYSTPQRYWHTHSSGAESFPRRSCKVSEWWWPQEAVSLVFRDCRWV